MSEGTGGGSSLRSLFYSRLEEMSFRSGAVVAVAIVAVAAVAITFAVTLGDHRAAPPPRGPARSGPGGPSTGHLGKKGPAEDPLRKTRGARPVP